MPIMTPGVGMSIVESIPDADRRGRPRVGLLWAVALIVARSIPILLHGY